MSAGGPFEMTVTLNGKTTVIHNILIGEVWIAGGQSNMEFTISNIKNDGGTPCDLHEIPTIRFYKLEIDDEFHYNEESCNWKECNSENIDNFSAVAYYFALKLSREINKPIGIISANKGASRVESWTPREYILNTEFDISPDEKHGDAATYPFNKPGLLFENKILPVIPYTVRSVIWYQGESDRGCLETKYYRKLFENMVNSWKTYFGDELSFITVQLTIFGEGMPQENDPEKLANYEDTAPTNNWALIREQQEIAAKEIKGVYMVTTMDVGGRNAIHPLNKQPVGDRLALAAENIFYGKKCEYCGPIYQNASVKGSTIIISFSHAESGLKLIDKIEDLFICGKDGIYKSATATILDNKLVASCDEIPEPKGLKYAFVNYSDVSLFNEEGFPASPFRTKNLIL